MDGTARSANSERSLDHPLRKQEVALMGNPIDWSPEVLSRFWNKVSVPDDRQLCWRWTGALTCGYGSFRAVPERASYAHRFVYELMVAPIPDGLTIDHLCRNRQCVNPSHLEVVTNGENTRRATAAGATRGGGAKTHCKNGHPLSGPNVLLGRGPNGCRTRSCRACNREKNARYRDRKRAQKGVDE